MAVSNTLPLLSSISLTSRYMASSKDVSSGNITNIELPSMHMDAPGETSSFILLQMFSILLVINPVFPAKRNDRSTILSIEG